MVPRRPLLRALGAALAVPIAGCNTLSGSDPVGTPTRETAPTPTATPDATLTPTRTSGTGTDSASETPTPTISEAASTPRLTHDSYGEVTEFGRAVAIAADVAVVVAEGGAAYAFELGDGSSGPSVLTPDDRDDFGGYNVSTAIADDVVVVGGPAAGADPERGAVYLFERADDGWTQRRQLRSDEGESDEFGTSVAFDGDRVVVGDVHEPYTEVPWTGGAYVFEGGSADWTRVADLGTDASDLFGTAVAVDDDVVLVGAPYGTVDGSEAGVVYAYARVDGTWQRRTTLSAADPAGGSLFGQSVAVDGDTAVIGAPGVRGGRAYVFELTDSGWRQAARITPPGGGAESDFGQSVAVANDHVVIGAPEAEETGRAYVGRADDGWDVSRQLAATAPPENAEFGYAVAVFADTVLVGSPLLDRSSGAYLFEL